MTAGCFPIVAMSSRYAGGFAGARGAVKTGGTNGLGAGGGGTHAGAGAGSAVCAVGLPRFAAFCASRSASFVWRSAIFASRSSIFACAAASFAFLFASSSAIFAALTAFSSASLAAFFPSSIARSAAFLSCFVTGPVVGAAGVNEVGADATLKGLFGEVNGLGGAVGAFCAAAGVHDGAVVRSTGAGAGADDGAKEDG